MADEEVNEQTLDLLERRVAALEKSVYGETEASLSDTPPITESLLTANTLLSAASNSRKNIELSFNRIRELNQICRNSQDEEFADILSDFEGKLSIVLTLNEQYKENAAVLEKVSHMNKTFDFGNLKSLDDLRPQLSEVSEKLSKIAAHYEETNRVQNLIQSFLSLDMEISKGLLAANAGVAELENKTSKN